jgi:CPA1 family monovalent cation:H+ antiporter
MFGVAAILHFAGGVNVQTALLFGAMVSATDPVSVISLFRQMGIDKRLTMILEGESLFNDGTAVVLFKIVLALVLTGGQFSAANTFGTFFMVVFGGIALGALLGYAASRITSAFEDHLLEITLTMVTAYGSYLLAEQIHVSPVIAVVAAGIVVGNYGSRTGMSATTRLAVNSFWEYAAFLVNSLLFLLIGLQVQPALLLKHSQIIALAVVAVFVARMLVVYGICPFVSTERLPIPDKWRHLMFWGGLRGALVMALALSLPLSFPEREVIINMTFGVVLFTLLVPGLTMEPLVRFLKMNPKDEKLLRYQECHALLLAYRSELQSLTKLQEEHRVSEAAYSSWKEHLQNQIFSLVKTMEDLQLSDSSIEDLQDNQAKMHLLQARKDFLAGLAKTGVLKHESAHELIVDIDAELDLLTGGSHEAQTLNLSPAAASNSMGMASAG